MYGGSRIGIDLGGTKIESVVVEGRFPKLKILFRERTPTLAHKGYEHIVEKVVSSASQLRKKFGSDLPVGIGMPGSVDSRGMVKNSNTVCLNGTGFRGEVAEVLGGTVVFANDANCFALAEALMGAGVGFDMVFGVIIGTGTGGGLVLNGKVREGLHSICGEWGHTTVWPSSDRYCYCGKRGCVETYLAGPWVERDFANRGGDESLKLPHILDLRKRGDQAARACVETWLDAYGRSMADLINVLDPDIVVLGGGVSQAEELFELGRPLVKKYLFSDELLTPIVKNTLGDSAGVLGAAFLT